MRSIQVFGKEVTGWQVLPADAPDFEEAALRVEHLSAKKFFCYFSLASSSQEVNAEEFQAQKLGRGGIPWPG